MKPVTRIATIFVLGLAGPLAAQPTGGAFGLSELSDVSRECIACHAETNPGLYQQWGDSRHYRANVGCYECHAADRSDADAFLHYDRMIAIIVSPADCARCHAREVAEFAGSHHSKAARILGSLDN
ncbi:MAG: multiheme c-type cytochrome, partial [Phycisphaerales bacterium]